MHRLKRFCCKKEEEQGLTVEELQRLLPESEIHKIREEYCGTINNFFKYFHCCVTLIQLMSLKHYLEQKDIVILAVEWSFWVIMSVLFCV